MSSQPDDRMTKLERLLVWAGGAMFVLSLAACVYSYLVTWASPQAPGPVGRPLARNALLFGIFALHHSLFAREPVKRATARFVPERLVRSVYVWIASLLLSWVLALWQPVPGDMYAI